MRLSGMRRTPLETATEVACIMGVVALRAEGRHLAISPPLIRQPVDGVAVVAEAACHHSAVYTWPVQCLCVARSQDLHALRGHCRTYPCGASVARC